METYRFYGHSVGDAEAYRTKDEVAERRKFDPIPRFEKVLLENKVITDAERQQMWEDVKKQVEDSVAFALASPDPDPASALDDLFTPTPVGGGR